MLTNMGFQVMDGDEAFYFPHEYGWLHGLIFTNVDNFNLAGTDNFIKKVLNQVEQELTVSK